MGGWKTTKEDNCVTVVPINDIAIHEDCSELCKCGVRVVTETNSLPILVHSSFDGREIFEFLKELGSELRMA